MAVNTGGVEYTIKVTTRGTASSINQLSQALVRLRNEINISRSGFAHLASVLGNSANAYLAFRQQLNDIRATLVSVNTGINTNTRAVQDNIRSTNTLATAQGRVETRTARLERRMMIASRRLRRLRQTSQQAADGMTNLATAMRAIAGAVFIRYTWDLVKGTTLLAGRVQNLDTIMRTVGRTANISGGELKFTENRMKALGITTQAARIIITKFAQNNLELAKSLRIARIAQDAAVVSGTNSSIAAEKITIAIQRLDTRLLRNQGILINLRNEYQRVALATGRAENSLTAAEKQQIFMNAVLREGAALAGAYEAALQDVFKQYTSLDRKIEEAAVAFGSNFLPLFQIGVNAVDKFLTKFKELSDTSTGFVAIIGNLTGAIVTFGFLTALAAVGLAIGTILAMLSPWVLGFIAVATVVGGLVGGLSAMAERMKNIERLRKQEIEQTSFQAVQLRELVNELDSLAHAQKRTAETSRRMLDIRIAALELLSEEEKAVAGAAKSYEEFIAIVRGFTRFDVPIGESVDATVQKLETDAARIKKTLEDWGVDVEKSLSSGAVEGDIGFFSAFHKDAEILLGDLRDTNMAISTLREQQRLTALQQLDELEKQSETAEQLAGDVIKQLDNRILKRINNDNVKEFFRLTGVLRDLSTQYMTNAQIQEQFNLRQEQTMHTQGAYVAELRKEVAALEEQGAEAEVILEAKNKLIDAEAKLAIAFRANIDARIAAEERSKIIIEALQEGNSLLRERVDTAGRELNAVLTKVRLVQGGLGEEAADAFQEMAENSRASTVSIGAQKEAIQELRDQIKAQQEVIASGTADESAERTLKQLAERLNMSEQLLEISIKLANAENTESIESFLSEIGASAAAITDLNYALDETAYRLKLIEEMKLPEDIADLILEREKIRKDAGEQNTAMETAQAEIEARMRSLMAQKSLSEEEQLEIQNLQKARENVIQARLLSEEQLKDDLIANEKEIMDARRKFNEEAVKEAEDAGRELAETQKKTFEESSKAILAAVEDLEKKQQQVVDDINKTQDFIVEKTFDIFGEQFGGQRELAGIFKDFSGAMAGAGNKDQVQTLEKLFIANVQKLQQERFAKGDVFGAQAIGQVAGDLLKNLKQDADNRMAEIARRDAELELAKQRFEQAKAQAILDAQKLEVDKELKGAIERLTEALGGNALQPKNNEVRRQNPFRAGVGKGFTDALRGARNVGEAFSKLGEKVEDMAEQFAGDLNEQAGTMVGSARKLSQILESERRAREQIDRALASLGLK